MAYYSGMDPWTRKGIVRRLQQIARDPGTLTRTTFTSRAQLRSELYYKGLEGWNKGQSRV
jgi:hypothetical protein